MRLRKKILPLLVKKYLNINMSANDVRLLISEIYGKGPAYNIKYVFDNEKIVDKRAVTLNKEHYSKYEDFFKKCNPDCNSIDWLEEKHLFKRQRI